MLRIFSLHHEKIEQGNFIKLNSTNNTNTNPNPNPTTPLSKYGIPNLNFINTDNMSKIANDILLCIFKGINYFAWKYIKNNFFSQENFSKNLFGLESQNNFIKSKIELIILYKTFEILNKYDILKSKYNILGLNSVNFLQSNENLNNINIIQGNKGEIVNINNESNNIFRINGIFKKFINKYSENYQQHEIKGDFLMEILDNIELILRKIQFILFNDLIEKMNFSGFSENEKKKKKFTKKSLENSNFSLEGKNIYGEMLKFVNILSFNNGFSLFLIKNAYHLTCVYMILKYNQKDSDQETKNFLNDLGDLIYISLRNLIRNINMTLRTCSQKSAIGNIGNNCEENVLGLQNKKSEKFDKIEKIEKNEKVEKNDKIEKVEKNEKIEKNERFDKNEIILTPQILKIFSFFEKVFKKIFEDFFYDLILNKNPNNNNPQQMLIEIQPKDNENSKSFTFLSSIKSTIEKPDFIWNKNYRKEIKTKFYSLLKTLNEKKFLIDFSLNPTFPNLLQSVNQNLTQLNSLSTFPNQTNLEITQNISNLSRLNSASRNIINNNPNNFNENLIRSESEIIYLEHLENLQSFEYSSSLKEYKIAKIFLRIYNLNPEYQIDNPNLFLEALKQNLLDIEFYNLNYNDIFSKNFSNEKKNLTENYFSPEENHKEKFIAIDELLKAISNVINNSKADETVILNDSKFIEKFYKILNENIIYITEIKKQNKKNIQENSERQKNNQNVFHNNNQQQNIGEINIPAHIPASEKTEQNILINFKNSLNNKIKNSTLEIDKENILTLLDLNNFSSKNNQNLKAIDLIPSCLNLLYILSMINPESMKFVLNQKIIVIILKILNNFNTKNHIDPIIRILRLIIKNPEYVDKLNLSIFLFLLKKLVSFRDLTKYISGEEKILHKALEKIHKLNNFSDMKNKKNLNSEKIQNFQNQINLLKEASEKIKLLSIDIIKIIKKFINNERIGFAIKSIFELYLPNKIIDSLFFVKETNEISLRCLGEELELPDLIWNKESIQQSKKILDEDTIFIIQDEFNIDNFPQNLISHKLSPQKCFFFENSEEYKLDNIYIRIYIKDPAYNLGKNLLIFLKQVFNDSILNFQKLVFFKFLNEKNFENIKEKNFDFLINGNSSELIIENLNKQIKCGFTALLLIIEQINFNDFNDNLGISSAEEMKNLIKDENEKDLISLVQRSFDYQKLLSPNLIVKIVNFIIFSMGFNNNLSLNKNNILEIDEELRLILLQVLYLLSVNKNGIKIISEMIDINEILYEFYNLEDEITDCKLFFSFLY